MRPRSYRGFGGPSNPPPEQRPEVGDPGPTADRDLDDFERERTACRFALRRIRPGELSNESYSESRSSSPGIARSQVVN